MVAVPNARPVTIPVEPTLAVAGALLVHRPPPASDNAFGEPRHISFDPAIGAGEEITDNVVALVQPAAVV